MQFPKIVALLLVSASATAAPPDAPAHYDLDAQVDLDKGTMAAVLTIDLSAAEARDETSLLLGDRFEVTAIDAGPGAATEVAPTDKPFPTLQRISIRTKAGSPAPRRIKIKYEGPLNPPKETSAVVAASSEGMELFIDSFWLPVRDDFTLTFSADATIRGVPADMVIVSPGDIRREGATLHLRHDVPDIDFTLVGRRGLQKIASSDLEIYADTIKGNPYVDLYQRHGMAAIAYFKKLFGPMRHRPIRLVVVNRSEGPGYARRGYIVVTHRAEKPDDQSVAGFVGHELAHGWWNTGGPMTEDYWMTESMASYSSGRYCEAAGITLPTEVIAQQREAATKTGPILGNGRPSGEAIYGKGPLLLYDLERRIGRPKMDRILGDLGRKPPRVTRDFLDKVAEVAGAPAAQEFEAALRADGYKP